MFYDQFISLCKRDNVKPTPLIKQLGFSAGNIKRWENGATVNSDILLAVSKHFKVSIDYLLNGKESIYLTTSTNTDETEQARIKSIDAKEQRLLNAFRALPLEEQFCFIGKIEQEAENYKSEENVG